jgi:hypothetical protein
MTNTAPGASWRLSRTVLSQPTAFDAETLRIFKQVFFSSLGWGQNPNQASASPPTEPERYRIVPLIFGLMPARGLVRDRKDERIKPHIREHLASLGLGVDEDLVDIIKFVCDQYYSTQTKGSIGSSSRPRKYGLSDIKALNRRLYQQMIRRQNQRCVVCGLILDHATEETLDHILPWRLVGDIPSGTNWQIVCQECNNGKRAWFSALQSPESINWIYAGHDQVIPHERPTLETRYVVLAQLAQCQIANCTHTASSARLHLVKCFQSGLAVADNLTILCDGHCSAGEYR